jgi:hypothetical protein
MDRHEEKKSGGAARAGRKGRGSALPALAMLVATGLGAPATAGANPIEIEGTVGGCLGCMDAYEVKCTKASRFLQVTLEAIPPEADEDFLTRFQMTAVGTSPIAMDNQDFVRIAETLPGKNPITTAMVRPGPEGTMKAVVVVTPVLFSAAGTSYRLVAECAKGDLFGDEPITSTKTVVVQRKNG